MNDRADSTLEGPLPRLGLQCHGPAHRCVVVADLGGSLLAAFRVTIELRYGVWHDIEPIHYLGLLHAAECLPACFHPFHVEYHWQGMEPG